MNTEGKIKFVPTPPRSFMVWQAFWERPPRRMRYNSRSLDDKTLLALIVRINDFIDRPRTLRPKQYRPNTLYRFAAALIDRKRKR